MYNQSQGSKKTANMKCFVNSYCEKSYLQKQKTAQGLHRSCPVIDKVGNVEIFVLLQLSKLDGYSYQSLHF